MSRPASTFGVPVQALAGRSALPRRRTNHPSTNSRSASSSSRTTSSGGCSPAQWTRVARTAASWARCGGDHRWAVVRPGGGAAMPGRPHVVGVGAGFGGLAAARGLVDADVEVTIVDRNNFHTFQRLLYQVATAGLSGVDVGHAVRAMFHRQANVRFRRAKVVGVDWDDRQVELADG